MRNTRSLVVRPLIALMLLVLGYVGFTILAQTLIITVFPPMVDGSVTRFSSYYGSGMTYLYFWNAAVMGGAYWLATVRLRGFPAQRVFDETVLFGLLFSLISSFMPAIIFTNQSNGSLGLYFSHIPLQFIPQLLVPLGIVPVGLGIASSCLAFLIARYNKSGIRWQSHDHPLALGILLPVIGAVTLLIMWVWDEFRLWIAASNTVDPGPPVGRNVLDALNYISTLIATCVPLLVVAAVATLQLWLWYRRNTRPDSPTHFADSSLTIGEAQS